jgi:type VI secretion system protein ImpA
MSGEMQERLTFKEQILKPVSEAEQVGRYIRFEGIFDRIKEAKREDAQDIPVGVWQQSNNKKADWKEVQDLCEQTLALESKDLLLAAWLVESMIHTDGLPGFFEGFGLLTELTRSFWEDLYPKWEEEDPEARVAPLLWLDDKISLLLKSIPLFGAQEKDFVSPALVEWERLMGFTHSDGLHGTKMTESERTEQLGNCAARISVPMLESTHLLLLNCLQEIQNYRTFLAEKCGNHAPTFLKIRKVFEAAKGVVQTLCQEKGHPLPLQNKGHDSRIESLSAQTQDFASPLPLLSPSTDLHSTSANLHTLATRAEAYALLRKVAKFLEEHEPHSPAAFLLKRVATWEKKTLPELLHELLKDDNEKSRLNEFLGMGPLRTGKH